MAPSRPSIPLMSRLSRCCASAPAHPLPPPFRAPESDGFSMKKRWQENGLSTVSSSARRKDPSGCNTQLWATSARLAAMIWPTICALTVGLVHSTSVSDPAVQVATHPVGRADIDLRLLVRQPVTVAETDDARMLEEPADDGFDADVLAQPPDTRTQAARCSRMTEVDPHAGLAGLVRARRSHPPRSRCSSWPRPLRACPPAHARPRPSAPL